MSRFNTLYMAPNGRNNWTGLLPEPNPQGTDGPIKSMEAARERVLSFRRQGLALGEVTVYIRQGRYLLDKPIEFDEADSGPTTYAAYPGEMPIFTGGVQVGNWKEDIWNGISVWSADVKDLCGKYGCWKSLFVNGRRKRRPKLPKEGYYRMKEVPGFDFDAELFEGTDRFIAKAGDIKGWTKDSDMDVIASHYWVQERMPIISYDNETGLVVSDRTSIFNLEDSWNCEWSKYQVENVGEALTERGEWFLDKSSSRLLYIPEDDETREELEVIIPTILQLLRVCGRPGNKVKGLRFRGLTFEHTDWRQPSGWGRWYDPYKPEHEWRPKASFRHFRDCTNPEVEYAAVPQAAFDLPGAIHFEWVENCSFEDCNVQHVGFYGISLGEGSQGNLVSGNSITDMGGGGIILDGGDHECPTETHNCRNRIEDNTIFDGCYSFPSAVGIASVHGYQQSICHNEIRAMGYSGISCGWVWGSGENISRENVIEYNHIYDLGRRGGLSDLGGIYLLGRQPGTMVRFNRIHDITKAVYGGTGIYPDEGSSFMTIESNLIYRTNDQGINEHWGYQNIYRNNIIAFPGNTGASFCGEERVATVSYPPLGCLFINNIILTEGQAMLMDYAGYMDQGILYSDRNTYWDADAGVGTTLWVDNQGTKSMGLETTRCLGLDPGSVVADPLFVDAKAGDFRLREDSPALGTGFRTWDYTEVGPRL